MWYAFLLACGSSTDNFAVGASLGISNRPLKSSANAIISLLNAAGAYVSAAGGHWLGGAVAPRRAAFFAGAVFAYLAAGEIVSWRRGAAESALTTRPGGAADAARIAVPMTLNNLAGGAAEGAAGVDAETAGATAYVASYCAMKLGHVVGANLANSVGKKIDARIISSAIFACLAVMQFTQFFVDLGSEAKS